MDIELAREIMECLPKERTKYYYFKDMYALQLLKWHCSGGRSVRELKQGAYGKLLQKPLVRDALRCIGNGMVFPELLHDYWPDEIDAYTLSLGLWGSDRKRRGRSNYHQTSRTGYNLVLQLNFCNQHDLEYQRLLGNPAYDPFVMCCHPVSRARNTMAWARIDLDLETGVALIEEIQNDWLREVEWSVQEARSYLEKQKRNEDSMSWYEDFSPEATLKYFETAIRQYQSTWAETMLSAALFFLVEEIGIEQVFYHSWKTGRAVKKCSPPKSIYSKLPEKFCFNKTATGPAFLYEDKSSRRKMKKIQDQQWYLLDLSNKERCYEEQQTAQPCCA
ncbi:hypothetical protein [Biformimicrobium ophioploci]|uniref:Uncharacterized protein n=1 Tax=Biformimicrobium ophioploci TaxID=3036711 RepID=A0ABQ6LV75_9GAMM|nr:hypothetical protein [Microbulbifer sp. NKW57]GMG85982.1 hypothetical protein MNKW57_03030 [Microbulbifer sp. NKW57]